MLRKKASTIGNMLHLEIYAVPRKYRTQFNKRAKKPISFARRITLAGGGSGPHFYRVCPQRTNRGLTRLSSLFKVRPSEDLWVEITFYPSKQRRRAIMREIWTSKGFADSVGALEGLNSKRPGAWAIANAAHQAI